MSVETDASTTGYGEGSPLPPVTGETQSAAVETASSAAEVVEGRLVGDSREIVRDVRSTFAHAPTATFAVETAILDAFCRERDISLAELFGGTPSPVVTDMTLGTMLPEKAADRAKRAVNAEFDHLKMKTGNDVDADVERVIAVAEAAPDATLKIDANQDWTSKEMAWFANRVADQGVRLDLIEQPVSKADLAGLAAIRKRADVPIAAEEVVFTPEDAIAVVRTNDADVINVKLGKSDPSQSLISWPSRGLLVSN